LKFAAVFAKQEREVLAANQPEVRAKEFLDGGKGVFQPPGSGSKFIGPGVGGCEQQKTARPDSSGQNPLQEFFWILHPVEEVRGENEIKHFQFR